MKIAVITGASSGMGLEFAKAIDGEETLDEIWLIARRKERLDELAKELRAPVRAFSYDLTDKKSFDEYKKLLESEKPEVATLCNSAGCGDFALTTEPELEKTLGVIDLNDRALVAVTCLTLPYMKRGSRIINLGSMSAFQPVPYINVYAASKAFALSFSRGLGVELEPRGIRVMAVCPGWVETEFFDRAITDNGAVTYFNVTWTAKQVVDRAMKDFKRGKEISILGFGVRLQALACKLLPHKLVMKTWMKQQRHDKRPRED